MREMVNCAVHDTAGIIIFAASAIVFVTVLIFIVIDERKSTVRARKLKAFIDSYHGLPEKDER